MPLPSQFTASGDAPGSARKPVHGSQSGRLTSTLTSTYQLGAQARLSASTNGHQTAPTNGYSGSPVSSGPHTPDSESASRTRYDLQGPSTLEPTSCTVYTTHAASSIHMNASTMAPQMPPALRPIYFDNYASEAGTLLNPIFEET